MQVKVKIKALLINDTRHLAGSLIELPDDVAAAHARAGHVEIVEAPKPKRTTKSKPPAEES